tara:strand:- start:6366 stop:7553 length:1188 start_codon:yes stop_codon:yes gene_type:complete
MDYLIQKKYNLVFLIIILISSIINYKILYGFRITDFLILVFLITNISFLKIKDITLLIYVTAALLLGFVIGISIIEQSNFYLEKIAIIYKIIMPLSFFLILKNLKIIEMNRKIIYIVINIIFLLLIINILFYKIISDLNINLSFFEFNINNFSFPFTASYTWRGDKHILSSLLLVIGIMNLIVLKNKVLIIANILMNYYLISLLDSTLYTLFFNFFLFYIVIRWTYLNFFINNKIKFLLVIVFILLSLISLLNTALDNKIFDIISSNIEYFNTGLIQDARIDSLQIYAPQNFITLIFGGNYYQPPFYYDSGFFVLLNSFGIVNFLVIIYLINKNSRKELIFKNKEFILFIIIIFSNLFVTEFFLTTRYIVPIISIIYLLSSKNLNKETENKKNNE